MTNFVGEGGSGEEVVRVRLWLSDLVEREMLLSSCVIEVYAFVYAIREQGRGKEVGEWKLDQSRRSVVCSTLAELRVPRNRGQTTRISFTLLRYDVEEEAKGVASQQRN